jgi:hypothetical protein
MMEPGVDGLSTVDFTSYHHATWVDTAQAADAVHSSAYSEQRWHLAR